MIHRNRKAFTLLELIMVMVVLGIVSSIGASLIADIYKSYTLQRAVQRASLRTELAAQQIANYLSHRIPGTVLARDPNNLSDTLLATEADPTLTIDDLHTVLEWIGEASDSFLSTRGRKPGWSGFCDLSDSNQTVISTPGSRLDLARTVILNLSGGSTDLNTAGGPNVAIFFRDRRYSKNPTMLYDPKSCLGMLGNTPSCISTVRRIDNTHLRFVRGSTNNKKLLVEHYKLAWTAYALVPFKTDGSGPCARGEKPCDLRLYYAYQPWESQPLNLSAGILNYSTLITDVTVFKFTAVDNALRFKLCARERIGEDYNITICKEKAVIR